MTYEWEREHTAIKHRVHLGWIKSSDRTTGVVWDRWAQTAWREAGPSAFLMKHRARFTFIELMRRFPER